MKTKSVIFTLFLLFLATSNYAQEKWKGKVGLSGSIQGNQFGILVPIWLGEKFVLAPAFELKFAQHIGTDLSIGVVPRFYIKNEKLAPYVGLKIGILANYPSIDNQIDPQKKIDFIGGAAFGADYFLSENFCFGVEVQLNMSISDENSVRFGNPDGTNFNTGTMVSATIYFK